MAPPFSILLLLLCLPSSSPALLSLPRGSSLSVENPSDVLVSPAGAFSAGFFPVGHNAYSFAIWHGSPNCTGDSCVPVWMANRNLPVNGKGSRLSLLDSGELILTDAGDSTVWPTSVIASKAEKLQLNETGNLVLAGENGETLWQSFDFPTDTLLPMQVMKRDTVLISSRSRYALRARDLFVDFPLPHSIRCFRKIKIPCGSLPTDRTSVSISVEVSTFFSFRGFVFG